MSETNPELGINGYLPELIPDSYFESLFEARVVTNWWTHPECLSMADAIERTVDTLSPRETLEFATYIDKAYLSHTIDYEAMSWLSWGRLDNLSVDEKGVVSAIVGHITDVKAFFKKSTNETRKPGVEDFSDGFYEAILAAAERWKGGLFASELLDKIRLEQVRRQNLHNVTPSRNEN